MGVYGLVNLVQCQCRAGRKHGAKCVHFYWPVGTPSEDGDVPDVFKEIVMADMERLKVYGSANYVCCRGWLALHLVVSSVRANVLGGDRLRHYRCDDIGGRQYYKCVRGAQRSRIRSLASRL